MFDRKKEKDNVVEKEKTISSAKLDKNGKKVKVEKTSKNGKPSWGMGYYTRQNTEICLIGVKDKKHRIKPLVRNVLSVVHSERREHSRKPDCIRNFIVEICGDIPRIELFARQHAEGWDCWGNEV